jgi:hypothetical protein
MSQTEVIKPASSRGEFLGVTGACVLIAMVASLLVAGRTRASDEQTLRDYQMSAYGDLARLEQGTYNDLLTAAIEIDAMHFESQQWPTVAELDSYYLPPFAQDVAWRKRGALKWQRVIPDVEARHTVVYFGRSGDPQISGSFLMWMSHNHGLNNPAMLGSAAPSQGVAPLGGGVTPSLSGGLRGQGAAPPAAGPGVAPGTGIGLGAPPTQSQTGRGLAPGALPPGTPLPKPTIRIWYHPSATVEMPLVFTDQQLVAEGWKEVVAYSGEDEFERIKGPQEAAS